MIEQRISETNQLETMHQQKHMCQELIKYLTLKVCNQQPQNAHLKNQPGDNK